MIILTLIIKKWDWVGTGLIWLRIGAGVAGSCDRGSDLNVFTKCGKFLETSEELLGSQEGLCYLELVGWLLPVCTTVVSKRDVCEIFHILTYISYIDTVTNLRISINLYIK
jgi:hypothetical protein